MSSEKAPRSRSRKLLAVVQHALKRYGAGDRTIVEEKVNVLPRGQAVTVNHGRVNGTVAEILPIATADLPSAAGLVRGKNGELDALLGQDLQSGDVHGGLREPHPFRPPSKSVFKVANPPEYLRVFVALVRQGHDHVVVRLGKGGTVPGKVLGALGIGVAERRDRRPDRLTPSRKQSRAEIEADLGVVVHNADNALFLVQNPSAGVGRVTFSIDPFIPIVIGTR